MLIIFGRSRRAIRRRVTGVAGDLVLLDDEVIDDGVVDLTGSFFEPGPFFLVELVCGPLIS